MASERPLGSGDTVDVDGNEGTIVRGVAIPGGYEYTVRVASGDAPATQPVKLPPGFNPDAAYGSDDEEVHEENRKRDEADRDKLEKAITAERKAYVEREEQPATVASDEEEKRGEAESGSKVGRAEVSPKPASPATDPKSPEAGKRNR